MLGKKNGIGAEPSNEALKQMLIEREAMLEGLVDMSPYPIAIIRGSDGCFLQVNQHYGKLTGYSPEQILGRPFYKVYEYEQQDDLTRMLKIVEQDGYLDRFNTQFRTRDNRLIHALISSRPVRYEGQDCFLVVFTYAGLISRDHQALSDAENRYQNILNSITECYYEVDLKGRFTFCNESIRGLIGYSVEEMVGTSYMDYAPDDEEVRKVFEIFNAVYCGQATTKFVECAFCHKNGSLVQAEISVSLLRDNKGEPIGFYGINRNRTEQKKAEEALRRNEEKYRNLLEDMDEGYYEANLNGDITHFNQALVNIYGYPPEELMGLPYDRYLQAEQAQRSVEIFTDIYKSGNSVRIPDNKIMRKDGSVCYVDISAYPLKDSEGETIGFWGISRDRTEQVRAEKALKRSEERYRLLVENANDAIFITQKGRIKFHNRKTVELTGGTAVDIKEMEIYDLVHPEDEGLIYNLKMNRREAGKSAQLQCFRMINQAGQVLWVELCAVGIYWEGWPATLAFLRDVTRQKEMETQLIQARKMEAIGTLAGGIAHDFNNILASMIGFTELVMEDIEPDSLMAENLEEVLIGGRRAKDLVQQILAFARQSEEKIEPVVVSRIVQEVLRLIRSSLPATITIQQNIESNTSVMGNATQIHQIVMNLCTNAAHAMDETGGTLTVELTDINFSNSDAADQLHLPGRDYLKLSISDTGCGISPEYLNTIFNPFFTTKGPGEGTGMGLSFVQGIVENYGGRIGVTSTVGEGTIFNVYLPNFRDQDAGRTPQYNGAESKDERVLLVDDESAILKMSQQVLTRLGYVVTVSQESPAALELFRNDPQAFDLVITDMTMPHMTGDQLAREMLTIRPDIPVVLCTGYNKKINDETAAEMGIKALVYKPIVKNELARALRNVLDKAE